VLETREWFFKPSLPLISLHRSYPRAPRALRAAMRALEEKAAMQRRIADNLSGDNTIAGRLRDQSAADDAGARVTRDMIFRRAGGLCLVVIHTGCAWCLKKSRMQEIARC
jgi:hypothetical protein